MAETPTLVNLSNLQNETTAVNAINSNSAAIGTAFLDVLSRTGVAPNTMNAPIDMNSNRIINLPSPINGSEPLRLTDVNLLNGGGTIASIPVGGSINALLGKTSTTDYDVSWMGTWLPVINPSSGNLQGSGTPDHHSPIWSDNNPTFWADCLTFTSTDPSAIATITVSGTPANGTLTLTFTYNAIAHNVPVIVTAGQTTAQIAAAIVAAVKANTTLFSPISTTRLNGGGYDLGAQIGYIVVAGGSTIAYDYDVRRQTNISYTAGTSSITLTFGVGQSTVSTQYALPTALDNNPCINVARFITGTAPPQGSEIFNLQVTSNSSTSLSALSNIYGSFNLGIVSSTTGSISSRWNLNTPNTAGTLNQGIYVGAGLYTVGVADMGVDTINTLNFYQNGTLLKTVSAVDPTLILTAGSLSIDLTHANTWTGITHFTNATNASSVSTGAVIVNTGGIGVGGTVWAGVLVSNGGISGANIVSTGVATFGAVAGIVGTLNLLGTISGTASIVAQATAGSPVLTLPNTTGTFAVSMPSPLSLSTTTGLVTWSGLTSGGILYASGTTSVASSALLTSGSLMVGGGAGVAPSTIAGSLVTLTSYPILTMTSPSTAGPQIVLINSTNDTTDASITAKKDRAGAVVASGDTIFSFFGAPFANSAYQNALQFNFKVAGSPSGSNVPTKIEFLTSDSSGLLNHTLTFDNVGSLTVDGFIKTTSSIASSSATTGSGIFGGGIGVSGDVWASGNHSVSTNTKTLLLKQGANGCVGTFVCNGATPVTVTNSNVAITDAIIISLNTIGGTVGGAAKVPPMVTAITGATSFVTTGQATDTSTYNYAIIKNAA